MITLANRMRIVSEDATCNMTFANVCKKFDEIILDRAESGKTKAMIVFSEVGVEWTNTDAKNRFLKKMADRYDKEDFRQIVITQESMIVQW